MGRHSGTHFSRERPAKKGESRSGNIFVPGKARFRSRYRSKKHLYHRLCDAEWVIQQMVENGSARPGDLGTYTTASQDDAGFQITNQPGSKTVSAKRWRIWSDGIPEKETANEVAYRRFRALLAREVRRNERRTESAA